MSDDIKNYTGTIQNLLYSHPLYNYVNKEKVNILVFGYSCISEKFIDFAFEMAQVNGYKLHITVVSDDVNTKNRYLGVRPSFCKFFCVDDEKSEDYYGTLSFNTVVFDSIEDTVSEILLNDEGNKYAYVFIGSDSDDWNSSIAKICVDCRDLLNTNFVINCVSEIGSNEDGVNYVHRNDSIEKHKDYKTLKAMAFNCHLVWNYSKLLDMRKLQRQFSSNYNYVACISYVISLKYKLASVGMDFLDSSAPEKFDRIMNSKMPADKKTVEDMVANEHKRWNVNMICRGFKTAESMEKFINGKESKANGYHPCLVRGTGVQVLNSDEWQRKNHEKWDNPSKKDFESLDELDRVSVLLHREYTKLANKRRRENIILQSDIDTINNLLEGNIKAKIAFDKYYICLQEINAGNSAKTALYDHYYSALTRELNNVPVNQAKIVRKRINALAASFSAILESEKYIVYKQYDVDLVKKIPFILTYKANLHIGIPIDLMNIKPSVNTAAFRIVESALLINPSRISYICEFERYDLNNLIKILEYAIKSMDSHHLRAVINICLLTNYTLSEQETNAIVGISNRIHSVAIIKNEEEFVEYSQRRQLHIFEFNRTRSSSIIERYEYCCKSNFKYNRSTNKFVTTNCNEIRYISFVPFLKISDIFEFKNSIDDYSFPDMQKDYKYFWELYRGKIGPEKKFGSEKCWKALCKVLGDHNDATKFELRIGSGENVKKSYLVEKSCIDSLKKLCKQAKIANEAISYNADLYSNNSYLLMINAPEEFHKVVLSLLGETYKLYDPNSINILAYKGKAYLYYDSLNTGVISPGTVKKALDSMNADFSDIKPILEEINKKGYIRNLVISDENKPFSFVYCTHQIKELLIAAGRVLELYIYYKLLETGKCDDVANSVEIYWGDNEAENEIDIIATVGYSVLIIEAKAQINLNQDYYNKLSRLDSDYGLNSIPVIVADTLGIQKHMEENDKMIEIGNRVGIHTVFEKNDISNIGNVLLSIAKNN